MEWVLFNIFILLLLALDLFVFHRKGKKEGVKKSLILSLFWVILSLIFNLIIYYWKGPTAALEFLTGYVIEKSLSIDNLFVMAVILGYFKIPLKDQHAVLFWGIIGALIMRLVCILGGLALIDRFHWIIYVLGAFLVLTGIKLLIQRKKPSDPKQNLGIRLIKKVFPKATPFMLALICIEYTDLIFALDSIPAIFAVTTDAFIIYTSNVFAILGLRALYSVLAHSLNRFVYLKTGIAAVLIFIGIKMIIAPYFVIPIYVSLGVIVGLLLLSIFFSKIRPH